MNQNPSKIRIIASSKYHNQAVNWCFDNFGVDHWHPSKKTWTCGYVGELNGKQIVDYKFDDSSNAVQFALRWQ